MFLSYLWRKRFAWELGGVEGRCKREVLGSRHRNKAIVVVNQSIPREETSAENKKMMIKSGLRGIPSPKIGNHPENIHGLLQIPIPCPVVR